MQVRKTQVRGMDNASTENVSTATYLSAEMTIELSTVTEFKF